MTVGLWPKLGEEKKQRAFVPPARREETGSESFDESKNEFEIKDPQLIFQDAWRALEQEIGFESMAMPKSVLWMAGAPGAGKGTMANFIMKESGIDEEPVEVSSLLNTPEARQMKEAGQLIGDREVAIAVLRTLCQPKYRNGIIIDGFPRTKVQAEVIALLFEKILEIRKANEKNMGVLRRFRRPIFHCAVLFVNEQVSVERQMARGKSIMNHNQRVMETGVGSIIEVRATDVDPELARKRYRVFKTEVYEALKIVKDRFAFHFIDASGSPEEVHARIVEEFEYQSSLELGEQAFEAVRMFPLAKEVVKHARSNLVRRLDGYAREQDLLLEQVMQVLDRDFKHIVERQALTGGAIIRSGDTIFNNPDAIDIALDVLTERGFTAVLDVQKDLVPDQVLPPEKPGEPQRITHRRVPTFVFHLSFPKPHIRRE